MSIVGAWKRSQNMIFKKMSEVTVTRSKWLVTLVIDLKPYDIPVDELSKHVTKLERVRTQVAQKYTDTKITLHHCILSTKMPQ